MSKDKPPTNRQTIDSISVMIGGMVEKVDALDKTVSELSSTISAGNEETIKYRTQNDTWREQISGTVGEHQEIASNIKKEYLPNLNESLEYLRVLIEEKKARSKLWRGIGDRLLEKWIGGLIVLAIAALLYNFAPGLARKIINAIG